MLTGLAIFVLGAFAAAQDARADYHEQILSFASHIVVHADSSLTVTETIKVRATGDQIKRGIYRDFPTTAKDSLGIAKKVGFRVEDVARDGRTLSHWLEPRSGGVRVYMGKKNVRIKPGVYTYTLTYRTDRQIGHFGDFDEIYWNVTGNDWTFDILSAEAVVVLPPGATVLRHAAYTGSRGEKGKDFEATIDAEGNYRFFTTRPFKRGEGLTVAVGWPKGFVAEPAVAQEVALRFRDNLSLVAGVIGMLLVLAYYLWAWDRVGRDPKVGIIVPLFQPPKGFSPAATRALVRMNIDDKTLATAIVSMAVKGYLKIDDEDGKFALTRISDDRSGLSTGEIAVAKNLFPSRRKRIELKSENHGSIGGAKKDLEKKLKEELHSIYFNTNAKYLIPGAVLTVLTILAVGLFSADKAALFIVGFMSIWLSVWTFVTYALITATFRGWQQARSGRLKDIGAAVIPSLFAIPFLGGEAMGIFLLVEGTSPAVAAILLVTALLCPFFHQLLKAPTLKGRKVMDEIEGFKMYLSVAEKERLDAMHPPEDTPEQFEKYLPYALALEVENQWSHRFVGVLANAELNSGHSRQPGWYGGSAWSSRGPIGLCDSLGGSFSSALGSSTTAPGGGGSGGGGSGGGGGGGGGGGF